MIVKGEVAREKIRSTCRHFRPEEFECKCGCGAISVDTDLLFLLEKLREMRGAPVAITSCTRCARHNAAEGGKDDSEHLLGQAVDIEAGSSAARFEIVSLAIQLGFRRIGIGKGFVHLGVSQRHPQRVLWLYS